LGNLVGLVDKIILVVNYKKEQILDYFGDSYASLPLEYVEQQELNGTASAVLAARNFVEDRFLVIQGDVYASRRLLKEMKETNADHVLSLVKVKDSENHAPIEHQNGIVQRCFATMQGYREEALAESPWVDRGIWLFAPIIFNYMENIEFHGGQLRALVAVQDMINDGISVRGYISDDPWVELGDHAPLESVLNALKFFRESHKPKANDMLNHDSKIRNSSVAVETSDCDISNSLIFGEGILTLSQIQDSVVYCGKPVSKVKVTNAIRAFT
jgi:NDP-sugar pyrophosphorylase family protein